MKRKIVIDQDGFILATAPVDGEMAPEGDGAPTSMSMEPVRGRVEEIALPDDLAALDPVDLQRGFRFDRASKGLVALDLEEKKSSDKRA